MDNAKPLSSELGSWKEIAQYLGVTVRTAQKWGAVRGLPVRRASGQKGRVWATTEELDRWREQTLERPRFWASLSFLRWASVAASALLLIEVGVLAGLYAQQLLKGPPSHMLHELNSLIVTDAQRRELWRRTFDDGLRAGERADRKLSNQGAWFGDLDGDGRVELLYIHNSAERDRTGNIVYCFSDRGEVKWQFEPGHVARTAHETFAPPFIAEALAVIGGDGMQREVVVTSHHVTFHPNQVALLSSSGKLLGEYWHWGRLPHLEIVDLDGDGKTEILLGGVSAGYDSATLVALDPAAVRGASVETEAPEDRILGFAPAAEKARLLFPRTCINRALDRYNEVGRLTVRAKEVRVQVWEGHVPNSARPSVTYTLDRNLRVTAVTASDRLRSLHHELEASGQLDHLFTEAEIQRLAKIRSLRVEVAPR
jgi:hypothetical protein